MQRFVAENGERLSDHHASFLDENQKVAALNNRKSPHPRAGALPSRWLPVGFLLALFWLAWAPPGFPAITYVDATSVNTVLQGGGALLPGSSCTTGSGEGPMDGLWHLRTGVGNGGTVWTADEASSGGENLAAIVTTVTFPNAGAYRLYACIWDSNELGEDWDFRFRVGTAGAFTTVKASEASLAAEENFANAIVTTEDSRRLVQVPVGVVIVPEGGTAQVCVDDDSTGGTQRTWYDGIGYERVFSSLLDRVVAIDFNKTNTPGAPSQALFRVVNGSQTTSQNTTNIVKPFDSLTVGISKTNATRFDFQGANGDPSRSIPGGATSLPLLVSDFIGSRDGIIRIQISNLPPGTYLFRSYHLEPISSSGLGYAQGISSVVPNTIQARLGSAIEAIVQPTSMSSAGLNTTFIGDADIPTITFPFSADGSSPVAIELASLYGSGATKYILLNGFEVFSTIP